MRQKNKIHSRFLALLIINQILNVLIQLQSSTQFKTETDNIRNYLKTED